MTKTYIVKITNDSTQNTESIIYDLNTFTKDIRTLADQIIATNIKYDAIICVTRGGVVPTGYLSQYLTIKKIYTCGGYFDKDKNFAFTNPPTKVSGNILMISDMCKSGETLQKIIEGYQNLSEIENEEKIQIDTACLHYFPATSKTVIPKYYVYKLAKNVFIKYPWE